MTMQVWDWAVLIIPVIAVTVVALKTRKYTRSVADFMSASRVAGRYLVATAQGEASYGATSVIAQFELFLIAGFTFGWWLQFNNIVWLFILLSGFIIYRYRESRVMTLAQFFEIRYSKSFRIFAGSLAFLSGILAYGIYPAVGARFFIYFCGFPDTFMIGAYTFQTFVPVMLIILLPGILLTTLGGQLTLMVVDCLEGVISLIFYFCVAATLLWMFSWADISEAMMNYTPPNQSMFNPFNSEKNTEFGFWFVMIAIFVSAYGWQSSQVGHGFRSAAINAHEQKMGAILGPWRNEVRTLMLSVLGICVFTYMHHPNFAAGAAATTESLSGLSDSLAKQMQAPAALGHMLPPVIRGMFAAIMLFALVSTDCTMMHSWGTILVQDVIVPLRKRPLEMRQHVNLLRFAVLGVAIFAFLFSWLVPLTQYINMFLATVGAMFFGAGACIIGGFYWRKGTTTAAWTAMVGAAVISMSGALLTQTWKAYVYPYLRDNAPGFLSGIDSVLRSISNVIPNLDWHVSPEKFFFNGQWISLFAALVAIAGYVIATYLTYREDFDLDRMLHRGKYAIDEEHKIVQSATKRRKLNFNLLVGITPEFTRADKFISMSLFSYRIFWFMVFAVVTIWNVVFYKWPEIWWSNYWHFTAIWLPFTLALVLVSWFTWGGLRDIRQLFIRLKTVRIDTHDDGTVDHGELHDPAFPVVTKDGDEKGK
ncbi:MAG: sodium:proline symporter [Burkholderiales bacterium]|nr:sodium:proline symporter [Phycisphaerae bacterium]